MSISIWLVKANSLKVMLAVIAVSVTVYMARLMQRGKLQARQTLEAPKEQSGFELSSCRSLKGGSVVIVKIGTEWQDGYYEY